MVYTSENEGQMGIHTKENMEVKIQRYKSVKFMKEKTVFHIFYYYSISKVFFFFFKYKTFPKLETLVGIQMLKGKYKFEFSFHMGHMLISSTKNLLPLLLVKEEGFMGT